MDRTERLTLLLERRPLVCDGAMGTELQKLGLGPGQSGEAWTVDHPERVRRVHAAYLAAGADLLVTNSFGGTSLALGLHGLDPARAPELNRAAARLAREVAGDRAFVLGDVGPFGGMLEPYGDARPDEVAAAFRAQVAALLEGGADAVLVETMSDPAELRLAVEAARAAGGRLVVATATYQAGPDGFRTMMGASVADMVEAALAGGAGVVGANCGTRLSLEDYLRLVPELRAAAGGRPVLVKPNAGSPELEPGGAVRYPTEPGAFGAAAPRFLEAGARILGGCCGSGPAHVAALAAAAGAGRQAGERA